MATKDNTSNTKEYPDKFGRKHDSQEKADGANAQIDAQCKYLKTKYNGVEEDVNTEYIYFIGGVATVGLVSFLVYKKRKLAFTGHTTLLMGDICRTFLRILDVK